MPDEARVEFRRAYREQYPDLAKDKDDAELDQLYDEALARMRNAISEKMGKSNTTANITKSKTEDMIVRLGKVVGLVAFSTALRWGYVAVATYWLNRVRHLFGREEKFRVRDMYMALLAARGVARVMTEQAVGAARAENVLYTEFEKALKGS